MVGGKGAANIGGSVGIQVGAGGKPKTLVVEVKYRVRMGRQDTLTCYVLVTAMHEYQAMLHCL